ncbi:hypothetical protein [Streptomyces alboflavus]|uniref:hypothetical protein n=1 Tax=Streptomyces alboflavus TaxID=67267 RepID=UPI00146FD8F6|nr:hypothetical protein [Streptomyces alboflavus]
MPNRGARSPSARRRATSASIRASPAVARVNDPKARRNRGRKALAGIRLLVGTAIHVDPRRALLALILSPLLNVVAALQAVGLLPFLSELG